MASSATLALNSAVKRLRVFMSDGPSRDGPTLAPCLRNRRQLSNAKRGKQLKEENAKLKKLLAEQMLGAGALRELLSKNGRAAFSANGKSAQC
jgi:hypothetical protein